MRAVPSQMASVARPQVTLPTSIDVDSDAIGDKSLEATSELLYGPHAVTYESRFEPETRY